MSQLRNTLTDLLANLRAIHWHGWVKHWKSQGTEAYSDHLLFQRIYSGDGGGPKIDDQIDGLGERMIALFGNDAVNGVEVSKKATKLQQGVSGLGMIAGALALEQEALEKAARAADLVAKGTPALRISLDNFVRELADARSTVIYLLQQRLKGGSDSYGAFGALGEQVSLSTLLPFVVGGIVIGALATGADPDGTPVEGAKIGAAAGLVMGLARLSNSTEDQGSKEDDVTYGAPGEISPYMSAIFPVVLTTAAGGMIASAMDKDTKNGALIGTGLGVIWSYMQMKKQDSDLEVEALEVEESGMGNVIQLSDYLGAAEVSAADMATSRNVILGAIALFAVYNIYGRMGYQP